MTTLQFFSLALIEHEIQAALPHIEDEYVREFVTENHIVDRLVQFLFGFLTRLRRTVTDVLLDIKSTKTEEKRYLYNDCLNLVGQAHRDAYRNFINVATRDVCKVLHKMILLKAQEFLTNEEDLAKIEERTADFDDVGLNGLQIVDFWMVWLRTGFQEKYGNDVEPSFRQLAVNCCAMIIVGISYLNRVNNHNF